MYSAAAGGGSGKQMPEKLRVVTVSGSDNPENQLCVSWLLRCGSRCDGSGQRDDADTGFDTNISSYLVRVVAR